jgi:DNA-directed RNA polymerase subunit RPC12/RpoP
MVAQKIINRILGKDVSKNNENSCPNCGAKTKFYDGALGYEAVYCPKCGWFGDHTTTGIDKSFIGR